MFFGGAAGSVLRALLTMSESAAPLIAVNVAGAFMLALITPLFIRRPSSPLKPLIATGLLGGFTSFSALAATGPLQMLVNLLLGWVAAVLGLWLGRRFAR